MLLFMSLRPLFPRPHACLSSIYPTPPLLCSPLFSPKCSRRRTRAKKVKVVKTVRFFLRARPHPVHEHHWIHHNRCRYIRYGIWLCATAVSMVSYDETDFEFVGCHSPTSCIFFLLPPSLLPLSSLLPLPLLHNKYNTNLHQKGPMNWLLGLMTDCIDCSG